jgi:tellurite methyltransferase
MFHLPLSSVQQHFGDIDIYLFDQILKGRIAKGMKLLDAGCGNGRNIEYLMQTGVKVYGADLSEEAIKQVRKKLSTLAPNISPNNFVVTDLTQLPFEDNAFDVVICNAVLHFANNEEHFRAIFSEIWRVLAKGGMLFCRLSTTICMEGKLVQVSPHRYQMPHGATWFLATEKLIREITTQFNATYIEPLKTVLIEQERSMTTLVLRKQA